jgi:hypothetical protein
LRERFAQEIDGLIDALKPGHHTRARAMALRARLDSFCVPSR